MYVETAEQAMLREAVRKLASGYGHKYYLTVARGGGKTTELWSDLGRNGYLGVHIPEEFGGGGGGITELAIVCEELAAAGTPSFLLIVSQSICAQLLVKCGSPLQQAEWLHRMAVGDAKMAFSITEPDAGTNSHRLSTTAIRDGDTYRLNGAKYYASAVDEADAVVVVARTGVDETTGRGRLSLFLVDPHAPGLSMQNIPVEMTSPEKQFSLFFDNVAVPAASMIGNEGEGLRHLFAGLNPERIMAAALENGIGLYALNKASEYARQRQVWDVPIGAHQGVAHPLAKCKIDLELARLMTFHAAWLDDNGLPAGEASNMAKYAAAEACLAALDQSIQTHGGNGLATEYGLATLWGVARLQRTAPVSREMILNYVAQHSLGLPRLVLMPTSTSAGDARALHVGAGLWALRSTAQQPASMPVLYQRVVDDARFVEALGYDSFWVAEHRFWYDGWCPQPLVLAAALAGGTHRIQIGTAMHLLSQHDPNRSRTVARTLGRAFPGRIQMGVSLGYRDEEFEGLGLRRQDRARLLEERLDALASEPAGPPVWVGGMADAAIARAGRRGLSLLLPPTLQQRQLVRAIEVGRAAAREAGSTVPRIGMLKDVWVGEKADGLERLRSHYREYVTAWWGLDANGQPDASRIEAQIERSVRAAAVGSPAMVVGMLAELVAAGVDTLVLQIHMESTRDAYRDQLSEVAASVLPALRSQPTRS